MSYVSSGKKSSTPSILKKSGRRSLPVTGNTVRFELSRYTDVKSVLENYVNKKNEDLYVQFVCNIRDAGLDIQDGELLQLLADTRECLPILNENLKLFVQVLLIQKWEHRSDNVVTHYQNFILDICSAYNCYTKFALQQLVDSFLHGKKSSFCDEDICQLSEKEERASRNIHKVIRSLLKIVPMSIDVLFEVIKKNFPFKKDAFYYLYYVHNILNIINYAPTLRKDILSLIMNKLIHLDVITSKEVILNSEHNKSLNAEESLFKMEMEEDVMDEDMALPEARTLDLCLLRIYKYIYTQCYDQNKQLKWEKTKPLYQDLLIIFENILLPTHASNHVQFVYFYFFSFKTTLVENFITFLWNKAINPNIAPVIRQASLCYISGIVARAEYVSVRNLRNVLSDVTVWIHNYIGNEDKVRVDNKLPITRIHGVFYSACHALFYLIAFRHSELFDSKKSIKFMERLNLGKIITCRFSPLNVCSVSVAYNFAYVMHKYQLTYCFSVMKSSTISLQSRLPAMSTDLWPDDFFPFDDYILKRSGVAISSIFREYERVNPELGINLEQKFNKTEIDDDNEDDFIETDMSPHLSQIPIDQASPVFNYTMSPGFK